ncbi:MAG: polyhydroxyalkanoic acid system family protein [Chloroflexota bacterium]|nr:polyhydroxyalkanoic acid system family protein [Chloroflexia bacterium]MDQ3442789.1 polyhydroxyalkanoic acid system family protein [Chloroflexota bacterium]
MPKSTVTVDHQLGKDEALNRIKGLLGQAKEQYGDRITDLQETWSDDGGTFSFKAMGFKISGSLAVADSEVMIVGDYPFAAMPFKSTIEATLRERAQRLLQP